MHKMIKYLIITMLIFIAIQSQNAWSIDYSWKKFFHEDSIEGKQAINLLNELERLYSINDYNRFIEKTNQINNYFDLSLTAEWLKERIINGEVDSRYYYLYASVLLSMAKEVRAEKGSINSLKETATTMFLLGRLTVLVDSTRCKDKQIPYPIIFNELELNHEKEIMNYWLSLTNQEKDKIMQYLLRIEAGLKDKRKPEAWICQRSLEAMNRYLENDPDCKNCETRYVDGIKTIIVPTYKDKAQFIDDIEWYKRRETMIEIFINGFKSH